VLNINKRSEVVQDSRGARWDYLDGCRTTSDTDGIGEIFSHQLEHGSRAAATQYSPIVRSPYGSTSDSPPLPATATHGFQTDPNTAYPIQQETMNAYSQGVMLDTRECDEMQW
jgi:hypothetical protein